MNSYSPDEYPDYEATEPVCAKCFGDQDISEFIEGFDGPAGCAFCEEDDAPTAPLREVVCHMRECLEQFYGYAVEQLPYESREGGYQGTTWDTYDLLFDEMELDLPRDRDDRLHYLLPDKISTEVWCHYDWLSLDYDVELDYDWRKFCKLIKHERRFFFAVTWAQPEDDVSAWLRNREDRPPLGLLGEIVKLAEEFDMVRTIPVDSTIFRCRPCEPNASFCTAQELGPPPPEMAFQANRMNPPGIPMMYGAETEEIAIQETKSPHVTVGRFRFEREVRIFDLADLPSITGLFSGVDRRTRLGLIFMHAFAREIARPVDRTDRIHIDYIPSQVVTEFIRDVNFNGTAVDGIRYPSTLDADGRNLVLFATQNELIEPDGILVAANSYPPPAPWIRLLDAYSAVALRA